MTEGRVRSVGDLRVWQIGMDLSVSVYRLTDPFPKHELYGITSQLRRAAVSVPANIAEGFGRASTGDYRRFLKIAHGSLLEVGTLLELSVRLDYLNSGDVVALEKTCSRLGGMIWRLAKTLDPSQLRA
jgi:four helix bundle protein